MARLAEGRAPCLLGGPWAPAPLQIPGNGSLVTRVLPVGTVDEAGWPPGPATLQPSPVLWIPLLPVPVPSCAGQSRVPRVEWGQALGQPGAGVGRGNDLKWLPWEEGRGAAPRAPCWGRGPKSMCLGAGLAPHCSATVHPVLAGLSRAAGACAHGLMEGGSLHPPRSLPTGLQPLCSGAASIKVSP